MKVLGITGGVGAGKSTIMNYLGDKYHARVIQADQVGHFLMEPGQTCYYKIVELFGSGILNGDQTINRGRLAALVFTEGGLLKKLNAIVHPAVKEYISEAIATERERGQVPFVAVESALLIEDHYDVICDEIWYIDVEPEIRKSRLMESRGYSAEKADNIIRNQLSKAEFMKHCQFMVDNSSDILENTHRQIDKGLVEHGIV